MATELRKKCLHVTGYVEPCAEDEGHDGRHEIDKVVSLRRELASREELVRQLRWALEQSEAEIRRFAVYMCDECEAEDAGVLLDYAADKVRDHAKLALLASSATPKEDGK